MSLVSGSFSLLVVGVRSQCLGGMRKLHGSLCPLPPRAVTCGNAAWLSLFLFASPRQDVILGMEPSSLHHLYLLHPAFPSILLDLANATGTVTASEGESRQWRESVLAVCGNTTVLPRDGGMLSGDSRGCAEPLLFSLLSLVPQPIDTAFPWEEHQAQRVRTCTLGTLGICSKLRGKCSPIPKGF